MRASLVVSIAVAALAPLTASAQRVAPLSERVAKLPDRDFKGWFGVMLSSGYREVPGWEQYFGDVGPIEGCEPLRDIAGEIAQRDLAEFRVAFTAALSARYPASMFSEVPDGALGNYLYGRVSAVQPKMTDFLQPRVAEMAKRAAQWAEAYGYRGRRLGYNRAGVAYWGTQSAFTQLVCAVPPANAEGLLRGWKEGKSSK